MTKRDESEKGSISATNGLDYPMKNEKEPDEYKREDVESVSQISVEKNWKYFWGRVIADLKNKNLIPVKVLFFFKYATLFVLYPFLTLHMDALGLDEWEIGINQATAPIVAILGPPFAGIVADRIGNFKVLLAFLTLLNAGISLLLLLVPVARETIVLPNYMTFEMACDSSLTNLPHQFILKSIDSSTCTLNPNAINTPWTNLPITSVQCGTVCPIFENNTENDTTSMLEILPRFSLGSMRLSEPQETNRRYKLPDGNNVLKYALPDEENPGLICTQNLEGEKCFIGYPYEVSEFDLETNTTGKNLLNIKQLNYYQSSDEISIQNSSSSYNVSSLTLMLPESFTFNGQKHDNPSCSLNSETNSSISDGNCSLKCFVQYDRNIFCSNTEERRVYNVGLTFGIYTLFRLMLGFASATSFIMFEGAVLAIMKQYGGDYGLQRVSATFAAILAAPLSGVLLKLFGFRPVFYLYAALQTFSAFLTLKIDLNFKRPSEKVISNLREVLSKPEILIFFVAMFWSGTAWGYLETFLFLFLKSLGATPYLMGLTISVGGLAGLPILIFSRPIIKRLGHVNVLCIGLLFYCLRYFGYSTIENPWLCLPFEALEAVTASLAITAASTYAVALSSLQTIASIQGIMGCLYFGFGRGAGSFVGGVLIKRFGHRETFRLFGLGSLVGSVLYFIVNMLYLRKHSKAHAGLDINNLNMHDANQNGKALQPVLKEELKLSSPNRNGNEISNKDSDGGGHIGPLDVNKFTDVPLDEEIQHGQGGQHYQKNGNRNRKSDTNKV